MVPAPAVHLACHQSLQSTAAELKYEQSTHLVNIIAKDEDLRKLRYEIHLLKDDNDELRELMSQEEDRSDAFEKLVEEHLARAEDAEARMQILGMDIIEREQQLLTLQAEKTALQHSSEDTATVVTEKLALTRKLAVLEPQLEHLRVQAASAETLMTEKLALQRQVSEAQCEVENAKREAQRALAKRRNTGVEIAQEELVDDLRRQLKKEKRARQRAEEAADVTQTDVSVDEVRKELAREKRARQKAEEQLEEAHQSTQVEDVRKDLLKEKKSKQKLVEQIENLQVELEQERKNAARAAKRADGIAEVNNQVEELRQELATEKKDRSKAEKAAQKSIDDIEAQKATIDDKLQQFREKVKALKEDLKNTKAELAVAKEAAIAAPVKQATTKNIKKRAAAQMDPDATTLGTPGDAPAAKRGRKVAATVGDKSTFSITPFLNRTASVAPESGDEQDEAAEASPAAKKTKQPLAAQPASKSNVQKKAPAQRKPKAPMLEMVTEEAEDVLGQGQENAAAAKPAKAATTTTLKVKTKTGDEPDKPAAKAKAKLRKSIHEFAAFNAEPEPERKKKRKLGGMGKTLFDEEEESLPTKALPSRGLFGGKGFGAFGGGKKSGLSASLRPGSTLLMTAADGSGFQFSPLKRSRKNLDDTLRG